jgi:hypothetical protein
VGFVLCGFGLAVWATLKPQSPGVSIGLLGLVAGIMGVNSKMRPAEQLTWVVVLIVFAIIEVAAIGGSDNENRTVRKSLGRSNWGTEEHCGLPILQTCPLADRRQLD